MVEVNGKILQRTLRSLQLNLKESMKMIREKEGESIVSKVEIAIMEATKMMKEVGMVRCFGQMVQCTKEPGKLEINKV